jgi:DNA (cytosine-5)-methyltransferase 1
MGYAVGAADLCAASASPEVAGWIDLGHNEGRIPVSVGPPHIRQRLFWVAQSHHAGRWSVGGPEQNERDGGDLGRQETHGQLGACGEVRGLADSTSYGLERCGSTDPRRSNEGVCPRSDGHGDSGAFGRVGYDSLPGPQGRNERGNGPGQRPARQAGLGFWSSFDVIPCADGKSRCVESGTFPLVARLPGGVVPSGDPGEQEAQATAEARVMRLRGYGNAIVSELASEFVRSTQ